jgi:hypothetical protein
LFAICQVKTAKEIRKELLARPSEVEINITPDQVKVAIVEMMTGGKWDIGTDSQFQMTFSKLASGGAANGMLLGATLAGQDPSLPTITVFYTFIPHDRKTLVRFRFELSYSVRGGRTMRSSGGDKDYKPEILGVLDKINERFSADQKREQEANIQDYNMKETEYSVTLQELSSGLFVARGYPSSGQDVLHHTYSTWQEFETDFVSLVPDMQALRKKVDKTTGHAVSIFDDNHMVLESVLTGKGFE